MARRQVLETILVLCLAVVIIHLVWGGKYWLWLVLALGSIGLFWPWLALQIARLWHGLALILGRINGTLLLSIVFLLLVWPIGLLARLFRKDDRLQLRRRSDTYFQERQHTFLVDDLRDPW